MQLYIIETGNFKLDGGAMFGVVPKSLWNKSNPADANNMVDMAARALLIEDGDRLILIDTGMGNKQNEKYFKYYYRWSQYDLDNSLIRHGFHRDQITDVFLTHLHFDHCGGAIRWNDKRTALEPSFKHARYWSNANHWQWATEPNPREAASFLTKNIQPIQDFGLLHFIDLPKTGAILSSDLGFEIILVDGHTEKQMLPKINYKGETIIFVADLLPTIGHIPLVYIMSYDARPLITLIEKSDFLLEAARKNYLLFFGHDAHNILCKVKETSKGVRLEQVLNPSDFGIRT